MPVDWFRNIIWSPEIEQAFQARLAKSRSQAPEYLFVQAVTLLEAKSEPEVILRLIDQYIAVGCDLRMAESFAVQAGAYTLLGLTDAAIHAYQRALALEELRPQSIGRSRFELPYLIATQGKREYYQGARSLLQAPDLRPVFPVDKFMCACSMALIHSDSDEPGVAITFAKEALDAAAVKESPFERHHGIGLVGVRFAKDIARLMEIVRSGDSAASA